MRFAVLFKVERARRILFEVHACNLYAAQLSTRDERMLVLAYLVTFRQIRIKVILAVKFSIVRQGPAQGSADAHDLLYRLLIDNRQCPGMSKAHGANIYIGLDLIWIVARIAKHL